MKIKILLLFISLTLLSLTTYAQQKSKVKVKIKKNIVYVNNEQFLKIKKEFSIKTIQTLNNKDLITLKPYSFDKPNPARYNTNDPNRYKYPATITEHYYVVSFIDFKLEYETDLTDKQIFQIFYTDNLMNSKDELNEENAKKIAQKISKDISGTRPVIMLNNY